MTIIIDAQLSPHLANWIKNNFEIDAFSVEYLGLKYATDIEIYNKAKELNAIVLTKDEDFIQLYYRLGSPPKIIWLTCGNTSNETVKSILLKHLPISIDYLKNIDLVEISD